MNFYLQHCPVSSSQRSVAGRLLIESGNVAFVRAVCQNNTDAFDRLLRFAGGPDLNAYGNLTVRCAFHKESWDVLQRLLTEGASPEGLAWRDVPGKQRARLLLCVRRRHVPYLPEERQEQWVRLHLLPRLRLRRVLQRARDRLDRPPSTPLGTETPTRDAMIAHLRTAGRRFAREYWTDGLPIFCARFDLGPVPEEFAMPPL